VQHVSNNEPCTQSRDVVRVRMTTLPVSLESQLRVDAHSFLYSTGGFCSVARVQSTSALTSPLLWRNTRIVTSSRRPVVSDLRHSKVKVKVKKQKKKKKKRKKKKKKQNHKKHQKKNPLKK
jgi:hypothetical protein